MFVNKKYSKLIKQFFIKCFKREKKYYETKFAHSESSCNSNNNKSIDQIDMSKFQFSKGSIKAVLLLNESILTKLFVENNKQSNDILLIYYIYFQLINHELARERNRTIFWEKCCRYFLTASEGQIGNLIQNDLATKIVLTTENITNLLNIIRDNTAKITPSYFSKLCGTTGLIVFFIKDILDYIGISNDKKCQSQFNITYKVMISLLDLKIEKISQMSSYFNDHLISN